MKQSVSAPMAAGGVDLTRLLPIQRLAGVELKIDCYISQTAYNEVHVTVPNAMQRKNGEASFWKTPKCRKQASTSGGRNLQVEFSIHTLNLAYAEACLAYASSCNFSGRLARRGVRTVILDLQ